MFIRKAIARIPVMISAAGFVLLGNLSASSQTATITALQDQSCAATRFGSDLNCTANDFTASITLTQPAATAISECIAGQVIAIDIVAEVQSNSPIRYDGGFFFGQTNNDPQINDASKQCSLGVFPTGPVPFLQLDSDSCGDYASTSASTLQINSVKVVCEPASGTNQLAVPYLMVFSNQSGGSSCNSANITANTKSKCTSALGALVTNVTVHGYVDIVKVTEPANSTQSFNFTTSASPAATVTPSTFSIQNGQTVRVKVPLSSTGATRQLTLSEAVVAGWDTTASISCVTPGGASASSFVSVNNSTRTITATLSSANYAAVCTVTNRKLPTLKVSKISNGGTGNFTFTGNNGWTSQTLATVASGQALAGATQILAAHSTSTTLTETMPSNFVMTGVVCSGLGSGGNYTPNFSAATLTLDAAATAPGSNIDCIFTNGVPSVAFSKIVDQASINSLVTLNYTITAVNDGNVNLTSPSLVETLVQNGNSLSFTSGPTLSGDSNSNNIVDIGETWTYVASYAVTQANLDDGNDIENNASFTTAYTPMMNASAATAILAAPSLQVDKTADQTTNVSVGTVVNYSYVVTNTGNQTINQIRLSDLHGGSGPPPVPGGEAITSDVAPLGDSSDSTADDGVWDLLAPGDSITFSASYTITQNDIDMLQ